MNFVVLAFLVGMTVAAPQYGYDSPERRYGDSSEEIAILRDDRVHENGQYSVNVETANGISLSESGAPANNGAVNSQGSYSYTAPDGTSVEVRFVADENGFQPQSDHLPVAPAFPHPIPQFVLDQIAFAASQRSSEEYGAPSGRYGAP